MTIRTKREPETSNSTEGKESNSRKTKVFVLDTNVILHDPHCIYKFEDNDIVIPIQVIEELDSFKKGLDSNNFNAREFLRLLDEISGGKEFNGGLSLGKGRGTIRVQMAYAFHKKVKTNLTVLNVDASIVNTAFCLKNSVSMYKNREVIIVSKDANLRLKARGLQITAEDYLSESVTDISSLLSSIKEIKVTSDLLNTIHKNGKVGHDFNLYTETFNLVNNEPLILKSLSDEQHSALVLFRENKIQKIYKEKMKFFGLTPKNIEQAFLMSVIMNPKINLVTAEGPAGSGKTLVALACALELLEKGEIDEILYSRKVIGVGGDELGFLPGDLLEKISPYMGALEDNLSFLNAKTENLGKIARFKERQLIRLQPTINMRGRTLAGKVFFLIDEAQNLKPSDIKTLISRAGDETKVVCVGDVHQIDTPYLDEKSNGLSHTIHILKGNIEYAHITLKDGVRSRLAELAAKLL